MLGVACRKRLVCALSGGFPRGVPCRPGGRSACGWFVTHACAAPSGPSPPPRQCTGVGACSFSVAVSPSNSEKLFSLENVVGMEISLNEMGEDRGVEIFG